MLDKVISLQEISTKINDKIGEFKKFSANDGYFKVSFRDEKRIQLYDRKISTNLSFRGTNQEVTFGHFKSKTGYNIGTFKNEKEYANHYGEYIAYIILKQLGKDACKVNLGEIEVKNSYDEKIVVQGILSHYELSQQEIYKPISTVIDDYKETQFDKYKERILLKDFNAYKNYSNIEIILDAIEDFYRKNGQESKLIEARKKFFDMCIFDIKFANRDRHCSNFGLKINQLTNEIEFYSLFDNEQILGFQENKPDVIRYLSDVEEYNKFKSIELTSCIGIPQDPRDIASYKLLSYLLEHYPEETMSSLQDINMYKVSNLEELMNLCNRLSDEHKQFAKKIFIERENEIESTILNYKETKGITPNNSLDRGDI